MALSALNIHTKESFVKPAVKTIPLTLKIINSIMPYYPIDCVCISGYLDSSDQFWKVNYHWELLVSRIDHFLTLSSVSETHKGYARTVKAALMSNAPNPISGYIKDRNVGETKDNSLAETITARHAILKQSKLDFEKIMIKAKIVNIATKSNPPAKEKVWWLSVAPLAKPSTSKHGTGYALDIKGNNIEITRISKALGATLAYNEASHVHVEWKNGVMLLG